MRRFRSHIAISLLIVASNHSIGMSQTLTFTDISEASGVGTSDPFGGHAAVFADVDNNGLPDLYITMLFGGELSDLFFHNTGGNVFLNEAAARGVDDPDGGSHGAAFADLDNDGDYDLFNGTTLGFSNVSAINNIFRNDGNGFFTDVTASTGLPDRGWLTRGVVAFDLDNDGDLDLFAVTNFQGSNDPPDERNEIYRNDGNMRFTSIDSGDLFTAPIGQGTTASDYDGDGDVDVFGANRTGDVNILRNDGTGSFTLITPISIGINDSARDGITLGDVDNDGALDLLLAGENGGHLYKNNGNGSFSFAQKFSSTDGYMGGFADLDNDGDLDLVFAGDNLCYLNDGAGHFSEGPSIPVFGINDPRALAFADIDNDGDLDFAFGCKGSHNWLVRNNFNDGNWLKIQLISPHGQAGAFNAKAKVYPAGQAGGTLIGLREARSNNGYLGQNDPVLHFGLGANSVVDVVVEFLDGFTITRSRVAAGQTLLIDARPPKFALAVNRGSGDGSYEAGTNVAIQAEPPQFGQEFDRWTGDVAGIANIFSGNTSLIMPDSDIEVSATYEAAVSLDRLGTQWAPFVEWSLLNPSFSGNAFDLQASATFTHDLTGIAIRTGMFYAGDDTWKFRFTGSLTGEWTFVTASTDGDLDGKSGTVTIDPNPEIDIHGFVTNFGNKWGYEGTNEAFVPQFLLYVGPQGFHDRPDQIDADIQTFLVEHGFNGFHVTVANRWFDLDQPRSDEIDTPEPDLRTFEALELLISKVHAAGGVVHIWAWGDLGRRQTPTRWGINGAEDKRLQRYIAARLGPLPGWTMGYGFDLNEWVVESQLREWHETMHQELGWAHFLGARDPGPNRPTQDFNQIYEGLDYSGYEQHKPDYARYVEAIEARPDKPSFSEDRFRMREGDRSKDYSMEETRRGLWHSTMAGGVANIWGNLLGDGAGANDGTATSAPYPNPEFIKTYSIFFENRFLKDFIRDNNITDGTCLRLPDKTHYVFYKENTNFVQMDLSGMPGSQNAIAVDTKSGYSEIALGRLQETQQTWGAPYGSDWAIAVGDFGSKQQSSVVSIMPSDDAQVKSSRPARNYGSKNSLKAEQGTFTSYLKFVLQGLNGTILDATLRLRVNDASAGGGLFYSVSNAYQGGALEWNEEGLNFNNAPEVQGAAIAEIGRVRPGQVIEVDVSSMISGNGTYSFAIAGNSTDKVAFDSKESDDPPQLVIETRIDAGGGSIPRSLSTSVSPPQGGTIAISPMKQTFEDNEPAVLTAVPADGYSFDRWSGAIGSANPTDTVISLLMDRDRAVTANFTQDPVPTAKLELTVTVRPEDSGAVVIVPERNEYADGEKITLTAEASTGFQFVSWTGDLASASPNLTLTIFQDRDLVATFAALTVLDVSPESSVAGAPGSEVAIPVRLTNPGSDPVARFGFEVRYPTDLLSFTKISRSQALTKDWENVNASEDESGVVAVVGSHGTAISVSGVLLNLVFDVKDAVGSGALKLADFDQDLGGATTTDGRFETQTGQFALSITLSPPEGGTVSLEPKKTLYDDGETVKLTAEPASGHLFSGWIGDIATRANPVTILMHSDKEVEAQFTAQNSETTLTFIPTDDAQVKESRITRNYGAKTAFKIESMTFRSYLKFKVEGLPGEAASAVVRLHVLNGSDSGGDFYLVSNTFKDSPLPWNEGLLNFSNAPEISGTPLVSVGKTEVGNTIEVDVSSAVVGNGTFSLGIRSKSANLVQYASKESEQKPELVVRANASSAPSSLAKRPAGERRTQAVPALEKGSSGELLPERVALNPNYPNPFNLETTIAYDLPVEGKVSIIVYNLLGQSIRNLVNGIESAGARKVVWDGRHDSGHIMASGIYFVQLRVGEKSFSRTMILQK